MNGLLIWPILLPLAGGVTAIFVKTGPRRSFYVALTIAGFHTLAGALLLWHVHLNGIIATQIGNWPAPFGITFVADRLSAVMVMITAIINLAVTSYSKTDIDKALIHSGYYCLLQILVCGICGAFLTGDIFNLYVWFEVMLMASFGLLVLGQEAKKEAAAKKAPAGKAAKKRAAAKPAVKKKAVAKKAPAGKAAKKRAAGLNTAGTLTKLTSSGLLASHCCRWLTDRQRHKPLAGPVAQRRTRRLPTGPAGAPDRRRRMADAVSLPVVDALPQPTASVRFDRYISVWLKAGPGVCFPCQTMKF